MEKLRELERDFQTEYLLFVRNQKPQSFLILIKISNFKSVNLIILTYRYLVPNELTAYHFNYIIRKSIKLPEKDSLFFFVNGKSLLKGGNILFIIQF